MLSVCELSRTVGDRLLWQGLNLEVGPGERVAVTGPSGSGKSLFLRALAGLDPLQGGDVRLDGRPQGNWPMSVYRSRVMYLPQRPGLGTGLVADTLRRPFRLKAHAGRPYPVQEAARLLEALERSAGFETFEVATLSGGEGQLLALVRALLLGPRLLLLDEATSALDPQTTRLTEELLDAWCRAKPDRALLWVSHDPAQRERVATREVSVSSGQVTPAPKASS